MLMLDWKNHPRSGYLRPLNRVGSKSGDCVLVLNRCGCFKHNAKSHVEKPRIQYVWMCKGLCIGFSSFVVQPVAERNNLRPSFRK